MFDGYPRNAEQADDLLGLLAPDGLDAAIVLDVPLPEVRRRMADAARCVTCGASVSATGDEDEVPCPVCGGVAVRRPDDTPEAIDRRLATYEAEAGPLMAKLAKLRLLVTVDATGTPDEVFERLIKALDHLWGRGLAVG